LERQRAVEACGIMHAPPDPTFHHIVAEAAKLFDASIAGLSIIDHDRMRFAARLGIDMPEAARAISFCAHAILDPTAPLTIPDMLLDERFAGNPFVQRAGARYYAGMPVLGVRAPRRTVRARHASAS